MLAHPSVIVGLWFLPVVLFIIIPLVMLCCQIVFRAFKMVRTRQPAAERNERLEDVMVQTAAR